MTFIAIIFFVYFLTTPFVYHPLDTSSAMFKFILIAYICTFLFTLSQAANSTPDGRRGLARIMDMSAAFDSDNLDKRDRVTWLVCLASITVIKSIILINLFLHCRYSGQDLKKAACFSGRNNLPRVDAKVGDMIGAMAMHGFEQCYKCMQITNNRQKNKKIIVQIIDKCAACKVGKHIDLTPGAFKKLSPKGDMNVGVLDISFKPVKCPNGGIFDVLAKLL